MKKNLLKSFFITLFILLFVFLIFGIYPFGDKTIIVIDSNTQYVSFVSYLKSIFLGNNDFKYLFSSSLGSNFVPLLGYYLMSPFNLLSVFFSLENMKLFMTIIVIIKICLCAVFMEYYLNKRFSDKNTFIFSISFALMAYNIAYMYHLMWIDSIILFPLVILGIDYIFKDKNVLLYIVTLALSIIFNYYIGVMVCIASVIYFIYKFILEYKTIDKFKVSVNYAVSSVLAGFLSMFILLPSLLGLQGGKAAFSLENIGFGFNISYLKVLAKTFTGSFGAGETWHGGPMIASGMLVFVLTIIYFLNKKVSKKEKILDGSLLFFLASTFVISTLDLLFHGLTLPNCFDYRHAFIFVFFYILIAYKSYKNIDLDKKKIKFISIFMFLLSLVIFAFKYKMFTSTYNLALIYSLIISLIFIYLLFKNKYKYLTYLVILDLTINVGSGVLMITTSDKQYISDYKNYVVNTKEVIDSIKDDSFYRLEKTFDREVNQNMLSINDSMIFSFNGISHFDSTSKADTENFLENLGYRKLITRSYYNKNGGTTLGDSLLGIKYVLSKGNYKNYNKILTKNDISVYENPYLLSLGYVVGSTDVIFTDNVFENQNNLVKAFSGLNKDVYSKELYEVSYTNLTIENNKYIPNGLGSITYKINIKENDNLYFYVPVNEKVLTNYSDAKMYLNGTYIDDYFTKYNWGVYDLGRFNIGDTVELKFEFSKELIMDDIYFYYENLDIIDEHYDILKLNQVNIRKETSSHLIGDINLEENSKILFTIPYDEGWSILVNGEEKEFQKSLDSLITIELEKGSNTLELKFEPKGLKLGAIISGFTLIITTIYVVFRNKIWDLYYKFKEIFNYLIVGVMTTIVSLVSYFIFSRVMNIDLTIYFILANTLSWVLSVAFAYITNKLFVFNSKSKGKEAFNEMIKFVSSRIVTYLIDLSLMFILVKLINFNNDISKIIIQFVVLVLNYIFSKLLVFKKY